MFLWRITNLLKFVCNFFIVFLLSAIEDLTSIFTGTVGTRITYLIIYAVMIVSFIYYRPAFYAVIAVRMAESLEIAGEYHRDQMSDRRRRSSSKNAGKVPNQVPDNMSLDEQIRFFSKK